MGRRGPAPKPTKLVVLEGNRGHRPLPKHEPLPAPGAPKVPAWLDDDAKRAWKRVAPELTRLGLLTSVDGDALAAYCQAVAEVEWCTKRLQEEGMTFETEKGYVGQRPEVAIRHKAMQLVKAFAAEFGLTPSARSRITVPEADRKGALADMLD